MSKLRQFFKDNDVRIGEGKDFTTNPPSYYSSLIDAFEKYFLTFRDYKDSYDASLDFKQWSRKSFAFTFTGDNHNIVFSILGFHRFIELLLKDILRRINPFLAVKFLEKEEELFKYFDNQIEADEIKTIEYSETLKRFKYAFKHFDETSEVYHNHLVQYKLLITEYNLETLSSLSEWRNRIMHNGSTLPNLHAYEYLISQRLIPLLNEILISEKEYIKDFKFHFFETATGIRIIDQILSIKFDFSDFNDDSKQKQLQYSLLKIGHLKELGRAAFNNDPMMRLNKSWYESGYENPIGRLERFVATESSHEEFYNLQNCICCGQKTLIVYRKPIDHPWTKRKFLSWFKCFNCDYSLKDNVLDPKLFGLSETPVFATN